MLTVDPTPRPETTNTVYLLSDDPFLQNVYFILLLIAAIGGAVAVIWAALKFIGKPVRKLWVERKQLRFEIVSPARYNNIVSPRGMTVPTVEVTVYNDSAVTLPMAVLTSSNLEETPNPTDLASERRMSLIVPLAPSSRQGSGSEVRAPDNWTLSDKITVSFTWQKGRRSRSKPRKWTIDVREQVKGLRADH